MTDQTEAQHILELSRDLLDDIELDRLSADKLLLKANRLARLTGSEETQQWLGYEMRGYNSQDDLSLRYMTLTGRWTDYENQKGHYGPLGQHVATIDATKARIEATRLSGDGTNIGYLHAVTKSHSTLVLTIRTLAGVQSRVLGLLHSFVSGVFYERQFADVVESTFEGYKQEVDALIAAKAGDVLTKIPSVVARLKEENEEAISQALTTCRRILETFADTIFPPSESTFEIGGSQLKLDASKHQNRINAYISQRCESNSRRSRLRQNIGNLFARVSTGIHNDVSAQEAYSLFLNVYLFLGEVLHLEEENVAKLTVE
ncbi:hypothetical protein SAMN05518801_11656 [Novosphingobium sp. CF614]|uniref:AbiTii domain-containing protein n=1 Tax=Novosphingobium sp. CF614 TaxID=1884364 RepID=UPI0008E00912|nr:hypothetical protein [Novosphingobium sp. CF614]SFG32217.1 hypothetical protein SAMN05518801_11656 [Novosphingobium sp. CF614]